MDVTLGIITPYAKCTATYVSFQIAQVAVEHGLNVKFFTNHRAPHIEIHPYWDRYQVDLYKYKNYDWLNGVSACVVLVEDSGSLVYELNKRKIPSVVSFISDNSNPDFISNLAAYNFVVCLSYYKYKFLSKLNLLPDSQQKKLVFIPFYSFIPPTTHALFCDNYLKVYWPICWDQSYHQFSSMPEVVDSVLMSCPDFRLTVSLPPTPSSIRNIFNKLKNRHPSRVDIIKKVNWYDFHFLFGKHDLTLWPVVFDSVGLIGLCSRLLGTPVMTFNHPTCQEIITSPNCGFVFNSTDFSLSDSGLIYTHPDKEALIRFMKKIISKPKLFKKFDKNILNDLAARKLAWVSGWKQIFNNLLG